MKKKLSKKKITLEDLALKFEDLNHDMKKGFNEVHGRIDGLKDHMDHRFDIVNKQFEEQTEEFGHHIQDVLEVVDKRFDRLEEEHDILKERTAISKFGIA